MRQQGKQQLRQPNKTASNVQMQYCNVTKYIYYKYCTICTVQIQDTCTLREYVHFMDLNTSTPLHLRGKYFTPLHLSDRFSQYDIFFHTLPILWQPCV